MIRWAEKGRREGASWRRMWRGEGLLKGERTVFTTDGEEPAQQEDGAEVESRGQEPR